MVILTTFFMFPLVFFLSLLFEGIDRKLHARMQRRIGPPIVQPFYDFVKLLNKESIIPTASSPRIFTSVPVIAASSSILGAAISLASMVARKSIVGDLILILYLLTMSAIMIMIGGSSSGNPYGAIGFSRKMMMLISYEVPLLIAILSLSIKSNISFSYYDVVMNRVQMWICKTFISPSIVIATIVFLMCIPATVGVVPFDIPEAKTEIVHGYLIEYSGPYLALARLSKDSLTFAFTFLAFTLFFYFPPIFEAPTILIHLTSIGLCLAGALVIMFFTITVPRTIFARLKIGQAYKFYWLVPLSLSILSAMLAAIGL